MPGGDQGTTRRGVLARGAALVGAAAILHPSPRAVQAKDYSSKGEALDELDRLAAVCGMRLGMVRRSRSNADGLVSRFLVTLQTQRTTRDAVRRRFGLRRSVDPGSQLGSVDPDLAGLRQSLDDLMIAYAESLPVFGDSKVVSDLALNMVEVSKLRTVIELWLEAETA